MKKKLKRTLSLVLVLVMMIPIFAMPVDALEIGETVFVQAAYFKDVPSTRWSYNYICYVNQCGLMRGIGNNYFSPSEYITRGQVYSVMKRIDGYSGYYLENNIKATRNYVVHSIWKNSAYATLDDQTINYLLNLFDDKEDIPAGSRKAWAWCIFMGYVNGTKEGNKRLLNPLDNMTREEFATITSRYYEYIKYNRIGTNIVVYSYL